MNDTEGKEVGEKQGGTSNAAGSSEILQEKHQTDEANDFSRYLTEILPPPTSREGDREGSGPRKLTK